MKLKSALAPATNSSGGNGKSIEDIYQKKTQLEHILLRPDTYIGSTEKQQQQVRACNTLQPALIAITLLTIANWLSGVRH